ncbi:MULTISPECIES: PRC-barrel domain containing protein [unclassified Streptomyces]|uniref:PRC-barrel domain containing protein n=1 Tax=unclassified Streptomyces TaxID=2593676 RepID=UPI0011CDA1AF|nr:MULTISPECIES: PRC-barrel domain containing protein [unclassified Streptomyces]TXS61117.1 PRC-barrel domain containing protein [Streptomyces sp. me109]
MSSTVWEYPADSGYTAGTSLAGFKVEATDGSVGKVEKHFEGAEGAEGTEAAYLVVNTSSWLFGKLCLLPAGAIRRLDMDEQRIHVDLTLEQVGHAPGFNEDKHLHDAEYHRIVGDYYDRRLRG